MKNVLKHDFFEEDVKQRYERLSNCYEWHELDSLTGGLNRKGFLRQVKKILDDASDCREYEILFFDIMNFKAINELLGIENGDKVLQLFNKLLLEAEFHPLVVARTETDHFACLARRQSENYDYIEELCNQSIEQNGKIFQIHVHCGIFHIQDAKMPVSAMLDRAKLAKINSEQEHKKCYDIYTQQMKNEYVNQAEISAEFAQSLEKGSFTVYYQPIVKVETGEIASAEALVRWKHPEKGIILPGAFVPALEKNGHISSLDSYMMKKVHEFQTKRQRTGLTVVPISVNLSGIDLYDQEIRDQIMRLTDADEIQKQLFRFEFTETSYIAMDSDSLELIRFIRSHGIKLLVDDFGKGYSSLGLLHKGDFDILKTDMDFVQHVEQDEKGQIILRAVIDMAKKLGLETVAEGVETKEQWEFLQECGCTYAQGYYFSRPIPEEEFASLLG